MTRGAGGDVEDPALLAFAHAGQHRLAELERRPDLHVEHDVVVTRREVVDGLEVRERRVVHEDVDRAERDFHRGHERDPVLARCRGRRGTAAGDTAGGVDRLDGREHAARELVVALLQRARGDGDRRAGGGEALGDELADAAAGAGDECDLAVQWCLWHQSAPLSCLRKILPVALRGSSSRK